MEDRISYKNIKGRSVIKKLRRNRILNRSTKVLPPNNFTISNNIIYNFIKKTRSILLLCCAVVYLYIFFMLLYPSFEKITVTHNSHISGMEEFLVWSDQCKIPNIDPYDRDIIKYLSKHKYEHCSAKKLLTNVEFNSTTKRYTLTINKNRKLYYDASLDCCYQNIVSKKNVYSEWIYGLTECLNFKKSVQLSNTTNDILVKCKSNQNKMYIHGHPMMPERAEIQERLKYWKMNDTKRSPSILMIGIDSMSRLNLIRGMPKTAQMFYNNDWFEMSGYNKIGDTKFPNLMAIMTGHNKLCNTYDNCPMIWKLFHDHGYVTAYAEDEVWLRTFNLTTPDLGLPSSVDYYLRPFMIVATENLKIQWKYNSKFCLGYKHSADYIFDYAIELGTRYKNNSFFGLFWTSSLSHYDINDSSSMDLKVAEYLEKLSTSGILNETVVIFFSDHGMQFGPVRYTLSGYFEERLPFMFIWLPKWLKIKYPEFVNGLTVNKNRLTNPYDIHMTLKNLLELSGRTITDLPKATDCPNCQSLLRPVPYNRSCQDIAIIDHWCSCIQYEKININSNISHKLGLFIVDYINDYMQNFTNGSISMLCAKLKLHFITAIYQSKLIDSIYKKKLILYRLLLRTLPGNGYFEATIRRNLDTEKLLVSGQISRLNMYEEATCIPPSWAQMYCHCNFNLI